MGKQRRMVRERKREERRIEKEDEEGTRPQIESARETHLIIAQLF